MSQAMFLKVTIAICGCDLCTTRFARSSISITPCLVSTISTTGMSVYCLMIVACRPRAIMISAP